MLFKKIYEDKRGEIYVVTGLFMEEKELALFTTRKGYSRGGCIHKNNGEWCCVLKGEICYCIEGQRLTCMKRGDTVFIPKNTQHYFIAQTDCVVIEWGATPAEKKQKGIWREYVVKINERMK